ncbi:MAG TPA: tripartite tricarboxylate transporter substrate binding protein [Bacillota bacterium]|nr:tripartite tricarboxylate transporter substrate binding protein [Bacillota bacterium]
MRKSVVVLLLVVLVAFSSMSQTSYAKGDYPNKPIQVVVPAGAGGDTDINARMLGKYLEKELKQPIIVVNVNGAGGTLGSRKVKDSMPDGHTVLFYHPSMLLNKMLGLVDYTYSDFISGGIAVFDDTNVFVVHADSPYTDLKSLIAAAKAKPGTIRYATETGAFTHLQVLAFQDTAGVKLNVVDVGPAAQKTAALLGKQVDVFSTPYGMVKDYVATGKFRAIGLLSQKRNALVPNVKTFKEQGVDLVFIKYFFYSFPKGTPKQVVNKFTKSLKKVINNKQYKAEAHKFLATPTYMSPGEAVKYLKKMDTYYGKYKEMLTSSQVQKQQ